MKEDKKLQPVGVIGSGKFGTAIARILGQNAQVRLFSRREALVNEINSTHKHLGFSIPKTIVATSNMAELCKDCSLIFPIVPSKSFRSMMRTMSPHLTPAHVLIHGTKGLDVQTPDPGAQEHFAPRDYIFAMSEVIQQESTVRRIGCLSGPNLSGEMMEDQPTATLIASPFDEVIELGKRYLTTPTFRIYGSSEIRGAELSGALKNIMAISSGILGGMGLGQNIWAVLVNRGLIEMIHIAQALGVGPKAFLGIAGMGDLVATCSTPKSRNYTVGYRLGKGESFEHIKATSTDLAEGVRTVQIMKEFIDYHNVQAPITTTLYELLYGESTIHDAMSFLMDYPNVADVDFL